MPFRSFGNTRSQPLFASVSILALVACQATKRDLTQLMPSDANGGASSSGGNASSVAGKTSTVGGATVGGATGNGGTSNGGIANGGAANGGLTSQAGRPNTGGVTGFGGAGGALQPNGGVGGAIAVGGGTSSVGGATVQGGAPSQGGVANIGGVVNLGGAIGIGGVVVAGGAVGLGGVANTGGVINVGGVANTGGVIGVGGVSGCTNPVAEVCNDGIDNDCNGTVDCPIVNGRFPEPGRAASGDDAWAQLAPPVKTLAKVECRSGKPNLVGAKLWQTCDTAQPTALTVYSMGPAEAKLDANNGVTQFDFRFVYADGKVSDPRSVVYYAHNSLWGTTPRNADLLCPVGQPDNRYFEAARPYIAPDTTAGTFADADLRLKNPFIFLRFAPKFAGLNFGAITAPQEIKVLSLRHRFVVDPGRQMLLVTRTYRSTRSPGTSQSPGVCDAAVIADRDTYSYVSGTKTVHQRMHMRSTCDAIVMNRQGTGVCLQTSTTGTIVIPNKNSSKIIGFIKDTLKLPWPESDPMMWEKFFDQTSGSGVYDFF